jgi:hypothetical protein
MMFNTHKLADLTVYGPKANYLRTSQASISNDLVTKKETNAFS